MLLQPRFWTSARGSIHARAFELVSGGPKLRRQYLDRVLLQMDPLYLDAFTSYQNCSSSAMPCSSAFNLKSSGLGARFMGSAPSPEAGKNLEGSRALPPLLKDHLEGLYKALLVQKPC